MFSFNLSKVDFAIDGVTFMAQHALFAGAIEFAGAQCRALIANYPGYVPMYTVGGKWNREGERWTHWCEAFIPAFFGCCTRPRANLSGAGTRRPIAACWSRAVLTAPCTIWASCFFRLTRAGTI